MVYKDGDAYANACGKSARTAVVYLVCNTEVIFFFRKSYLEQLQQNQFNTNNNNNNNNLRHHLE